MSREPSMFGVVLAGGIGRRLGRPKGDLRWCGQPLALRAATLLEPLCDEVLISLRRGMPNPAPEFRPVTDAGRSPRGPLAGIDAAFGVASGRDLLVLACDYPRVRSELLRRLIVGGSSTDDLALPVDGSGRDHPLVAVWRGSCAVPLRRALDAGRLRVGGVLDSVSVFRLRAASPGCPPDLDRQLLNVNRPEDLDEAG